MRVALIVPGGVDPSGTHRVIPCLLWLVERLARNHEVHVFALYQTSRASTYRLLGATVHAVDSRFARVEVLHTLLTAHRRRPFDLLHAFWAEPPGVVAWIAGTLMRRPVLLHLAGGELQALKAIQYGGRLTWRGRAYVRAALRGATRITAATPAMIADAGRRGVAADLLILGVDVGRWMPVPPRPRASDRPARLIHVASLNPVKDQRTLLRAVARLRDGGTAFRLDIVGEDTMDGEIQRLAEALELGDCVIFHGFLPHEALRPLVVSADVHVLSSLHESGGIVVLEAAVSGVPTVGTRVGHVAAWAPDAGVAVPVADPDALARGIASLLCDDGRRLSIAREAQRRAVASDADATAARVNEIYEEMVRAW